ncbi:type II toxin-antitoxin system RelE/ParE family toxin [Cloacibacillus porcorum]|uniref:type II toxin-antitoxin system RelE/ParE family toxin n=1 Tax=Cloacibacillus porcorum TaxID=1197717 RepID=UPI003F022889
MYEIIFYSDKNGREPVADYMQELGKSKTKDNRVKHNKISQYIKVLSEVGTMAGMPYMRHLEGEIWELRPIRDRILFAGFVDGTFILLHSFMKQSQKTPTEEIAQAKRELEDFRTRYNSNREE